MNCINCGAPIRDEQKTCPYCGKAIQIVPDYSIYDDDDINILMKETTPVTPAPKETTRNSSNRPDTRELERRRARKEREKKRALEAKKKKQMIIILVAVITICILLFIAAFVIKDMIAKNQASSYSYQVSQAEAALEKKDYQTAEDYFMRALALKENDIDVRFALIEMYREQGMQEEEIDTLYEIIAIDATNYTAYKALFQIYNKLGDVDAIMELKQGVTDDRILALFSNYEIEKPRIHLKSGEYKGAIKVMISGNMNYEIYYTLDGSDPREEENGKLYEGTIDISQNGLVTLKAVTKNDKGVFSSIASETYKLSYDAPEAPIVIPDGTNFDVETRIYVSVPTGCKAYYTWDRTDPRDEESETRMEYTDSILIPSGENVLKLVIVDETSGLYSPLFTRRYTCTVAGIVVPGLPEPDNGEEGNEGGSVNDPATGADASADATDALDENN